MDEKSTDELNLYSDVISKFLEYQKSFRDFKKSTGLKKLEDNYECMSGCMDKIGRLSRHVKHNKRGDPKKDFPTDALMSIFGLLAYIDLIIENFEVTDDDIKNAMEIELKKSIQQHVKMEK